MTNKQFRKVLLTINNPKEYGLTHNKLCELTQQFNPKFYCLADEIGQSRTYHTHIFIYSTSPMRFSTLKKRFPQAHIDSAYGTVIENVEYIRKSGKWADTDKAETSVEGTYEEYGVIPDEKQEDNPEMAEIISEIESGKSTGQIIKDHPKYALRTRNINDLRDTIQGEMYSAIMRKITVIYIYSAEDFDSIGYIYSKHNTKDICRVTDYGKNGHMNFDGYAGQAVIVFDNFKSQIAIENLLVYLDCYPCELPARYNNRTAAYSTVYFTSDIPPEAQYKALKGSNDRLVQKFINKIDKLIVMDKNGELIETDLKTTRRKLYD